MSCSFGYIIQANLQERWHCSYQGKGHFSKRNVREYYHGKTRGADSVSQHAVGITVNKQVKGKFPAKRINVPFEGIKHSKSGENFLKLVKENDQKKKKAKEKGK